MKKITKSVIEKLAEYQGSPVISIYLPTHRLPGPQHSQEDQTRFKNLLREAANLLEEEDIDSPALRESLKSLEELVDDVSFWQGTLEGLAVFIDEIEIQMYSSPFEFEESVSCGDVFDIVPLHMVLSQNRSFYTLALSLSEPKLYRGDAYGMEAVDAGLPKSMEEALNIDELPANNRMRGSHRGGLSSTGGATSPQGEGDTSEAGHAEKLQFFRIIERTILEHPRFDSTLPLLLAATENEAAHFKSVTNFKSMLQQVLHGSFSDRPPGEVFKSAWSIIRHEVIDKQERELAGKYQESFGVYRASMDLDEITAAIQEGRVDTLMVSLVDETNDSITDYQEGPAPVVRVVPENLKERLREAIELAFEQGAKIVGMDQSRMPGHSMVAALYRY